MILQEILQKIVDSDTSICLSDKEKDWDAGVLLAQLPAPVLRRPAYMQPGLYIAEVNDGGYLGRVLYRIKHK